MDRPFPYQSSISMNALSHDVADADFIAVKVGDVNASFQNAKSNIVAENRSKNTIHYTTTALKAGQEISVPFEVSDRADHLGLQLALKYDDSRYDFIGIDDADMKLNDEHVFVDGNKLTISYASAQKSDNTSNVLFKIDIQS